MDTFAVMTVYLIFFLGLIYVPTCFAFKVIWDTRTQYIKRLEKELDRSISLRQNDSC